VVLGSDQNDVVYRIVGDCFPIESAPYVQRPQHGPGVFIELLDKAAAIVDMQVSILVECRSRRGTVAGYRKVSNDRAGNWIEDCESSINSVVGVVQRRIKLAIVDDGMFADHVVGVVPVTRRAAASECVEE